ncbi:hypothetical protein [Streptomyces sp. NPDC001508]|uniref:hypothetical protein n=1 Tax=Streptomyces sp. NPDC001508 TaxID=3154656 RepID=UPI003331CCB8
MFVHNPEHAGLCRTELHPALREVFTVLEEFAAAGRVGGCGVATWSGFQHDAFSVSELLGLAIEVAGSGEHHLRAVQQPVSLVMAGRSPLPSMAGAPRPGRAAGLITFGSSPLHGGELPGLVTYGLAEFIRPGASPGTACLLVAASCPSLDVVLLSAGTAPHWAVAKATIAAPLDPGRLRKVTDVLAQG